VVGTAIPTSFLLEPRGQARLVTINLVLFAFFAVRLGTAVQSHLGSHPRRHARFDLGTPNL
jgi:hypothetical protein